VRGMVVGLGRRREGLVAALGMKLVFSEFGIGERRGFLDSSVFSILVAVGGFGGILLPRATQSRRGRFKRRARRGAQLRHWLTLCRGSTLITR
jgi:hypothetical protein